MVMQTLPEHTSYAAAGTAPLTWENDTGSSVLQSDTAWLLSFIDILTLLLTLFVLLLAYDRNHQPVEELSLLAPQDRVAQSDAATLSVMSALETLYSPSLPVLLSGGFMQLDNHSSGNPDSIEGLIGWVEPDATVGSTATVADAVTPVMAPVSSAAGAGEVSTTAVPEALDDSAAAANRSPLPDAGLPAMSSLPAEALPDSGLSLELPPGTEVLPALEMPAEPRHETVAAQLLLQNLSGALRERVEVSAASGVVNVEISDNILFQPASAALAGAAVAVLDELAAVLRDQPGVLSVEGHTDNVPIQTALFPSNWELSSARAAVVTRSFIARGVAPDRIRAIGYGDTRPRADNLSSEGRARNRRVSFVLHLD